jgi:hypothetical protein
MIEKCPCLSIHPWLAYAIGYFFSIFIGHWFIKLVVDKMHMEEVYKEEKGLIWQASAVGFVERTLYTASWNVGKPEFIAVWLALKVASQWGRWSNGGKGVPGRSIFNVFLVGSGLSILYAVVGAMIIKWLRDGNLWVTLIVSLILIGGCSALCLWAGHNKKQRRLKELSKKT